MRIPLENLTGSVQALSGTQARAACAESADAAGRLLDQIGGAAIVALLRHIGRGVPLGEGLRAAYPHDLLDVRRRP